MKSPLEHLMAMLNERPVSRPQITKWCRGCSRYHPGGTGHATSACPLRQVRVQTRGGERVHHIHR